MIPKIKTKKYEKIIESVVIDNREKDRIEFAKEQYAPFNPIVRQLQYGDYIFKGHNGVRVCFEFKTGSDFLTSISHDSNHLHNQVYGMIHGRSCALCLKRISSSWDRIGDNKQNDEIFHDSKIYKAFDKNILEKKRNL